MSTSSLWHCWGYGVICSTVRSAHGRLEEVGVPWRAAPSGRTASRAPRPCGPLCRSEERRSLGVCAAGSFFAEGCVRSGGVGTEDEFGVILA